MTGSSSRRGNLVVIENKLDDSGRDVTWQALKYTAYVSGLTKTQIVDIYQQYLDRYAGGGNPPRRTDHSVTGSSTRRGKATISTSGNMLCLTLIDVMMPASSVLTKRTPQRSQKFFPSFSPDLTFSFRV
ncbi:hypothetical protein C1J03_10095 [Sulfitobacter sp. SK012]|nr:hypothetical protein C1J03_10095 [Sulfitobacter sp. SK012]